MNQKITSDRETERGEVTKVFAAVEDAIVDTHRKLDASIHPVRETVLKRYPTLFTLLVTFGVTATFLGIEQVVLSIDFFNNHPGMILGIGIVILVVTGRVYKKLS